MSDLRLRDNKLADAIREYPPLVKDLIRYITEPRVVALLEIGGQMEGQMIFNIKKGEVVSCVPGMVLKSGYEIK